MDTNLEEGKEITLEDLKNFEKYGMRAREIPNYQDEFKNKYGRSLNPKTDMVCIGEYGDFIFGNEGEWVRIELTGEDVGDGWFHFYLFEDKIYLESGSILLEEKYRDLVKDTLNQFIDGSVPVTIDFRGLNE